MLQWEPGMVAHPIIPALGRLRKEDNEFKASLGYRASLRLAWAVRPCIKKIRNKKCSSGNQKLSAT
jgi:hypothetical protein